MSTTKLFSLLLLIALSSCTECEEKEWDTLPPETQTGANTFGCYVNGELFVKQKAAIYGPRPIGATYERETDKLHIFSLAAAKEFSYIDLFIDNPGEGEYKALSLGYFTPNFSNAVAAGCWGFGCENCGQIYLTKFDTINCIVSGRFEFSGRCADIFSPPIPIKYTGDSIVHVTNGRFDIKLN
jgi:hypothetical protein